MPATLDAVAGADAALAHARELVAAGVSIDEAARKLAASVEDRRALHVAHWRWTDRMHRPHGIDRESSAVLRVLVGALQTGP